MKFRLFHSKKPILIALSLLIMPFFPYLIASAISEGIHVVSKQGKQLYLYEEYHALVIGVSNYDWWPKLPYASEDAKQVAERLKMMGYQVKLILDPTARELKAALNETVYTMGKAKDRAILLYYAGHGETETLADNTKIGYIIPKDCPLLKKNPVGFGSHAVSLREIESISLRIRSKHVLMLFDSCFSGSLFSLVRAVPEDITEKSNLPVRQFITAGREDEQVPDRSIFKRSFLVGLEGDADLTGDGYITGSELGMYLSDKVVNYTHGRQHPQYGKINNPNLDRGDFIFATLKHREVAKRERNAMPVEEKAKATKPRPVLREKEDSKLDMLFWESIKDSNDCDMFDEYLKQFPNGKFSGLAQIYIRKLECDITDRKKALSEQPDKGQSLASLRPKEDLKASSDLSIAVFPWYFAAPMRLHRDETIEALKEVFGLRYRFHTIYSYYDLGKGVEFRNISENILSDGIIGDLWLSKGFGSRRPNLKLICELGDKLTSDIVLLYKFRPKEAFGARYTIYLVDVKLEKLYKETFPDETYWGPKKDSIKIFTEKFFDAYSKDKFK